MIAIPVLIPFEFPFIIDSSYRNTDSVFTNLIFSLYVSLISGDTCRKSHVLCAWIPQNLDYPWNDLFDNYILIPNMSDLKPSSFCSIQSLFLYKVLYKAFCTKLKVLLFRHTLTALEKEWMVAEKIIEISKYVETAEPKNPK